MRSRRLSSLVIIAATSALFGGYAGCASTNGDPVDPEIRDARALDVGSYPEPDAGEEGEDGGEDRDSASNDGGEGDADASSAIVIINEIYVDNKVGGDNTEFLELRGEPGALVGDLAVRIIDKTGQVKRLNVGGSNDRIKASGTWVIGGALAPGTIDKIFTAGDNWGLDNTRGAVQLVRGSTLLDTVGWGTDPDAGAIPPLGFAPSSTGEGAHVVVPPIDGHSFGRRPGSSDTGDNRADFCAMANTVGSTSVVCDP